MRHENYHTAAKLLEERKENAFIELFDTKRLGFDVTASNFGYDQELQHCTLFEIGCLRKAWKCVLHMLSFVDKVHVDSVIWTYGIAPADVGERVLQKYLGQNGGTLPAETPLHCIDDPWPHTPTIAYFVKKKCSLQLFRKAIELGQKVGARFEFTWNGPRHRLIGALLTAAPSELSGTWRPDLALYLMQNHLKDLRLEEVVEDVVRDWIGNFMAFISLLGESAAEDETNFCKEKESQNAVATFFAVCKDQQVNHVGLAKLFPKACDYLVQMEDSNRKPAMDRWSASIQKKRIAGAVFIAEMSLLYAKPQQDYHRRIPSQLESLVESCQSMQECEVCCGTGKRKRLDHAKIDIEQHNFEKKRRAIKHIE